MNSLRRISAKPRALASATVAFVLLALPAPAASTPLDKDACAKLALDMQNMKMLEVDKLMENGPAWAASNLSERDLSLVRPYIELDEQLKFRCSAPSSLVHLKHLDDEDEENGAAKQADPLTAKPRRTKPATAQEEEAPAPKPAAKQKAAKAPAKKSPPRPGRQRPVIADSRERAKKSKLQASENFAASLQRRSL